MSESLRRLVNVTPFPLLQEKLDAWLDTYHLNTTLQNSDRCREVMELNARVQSQLAGLQRIIDPSASPYAPYKSSYPYWPHNPHYYYPYDYPYSVDVMMNQKNREINDIQDSYERNLQIVEDDLHQTRCEADDLKSELDDTKLELEDEHRKSTSDKMFTETETSELRSKLRNAEDELALMRSRSNLVTDYERTIRRLRDDICILTGKRDTMTVNGEVDCLPLPYSPLPRPGSPFAADDVTQRVRQQNHIARFNDMFSIDRLEAMDTLRRFSDDHENNQRILFCTMQDAFSAAKIAFANFKIRVRSNLASSHMGPHTLEEAVQDYINRNTDLFDLPGLVSDVVRSLNRNPKISLPADVSYTIIQPFIREVCKLAWNMSALAHPLDISLATDAELYEDSKYRRSYDSEYTAPLVNHHIWPALKQGLNILMKGEACTRRGASLVSPRRSRTPTRSKSARARSVSPLRALSPMRASSRSRSPSPRRLDSSFSGRLSPVGVGKMSPSRASSRAVTASTALSHYGVMS